MLVFAEGESELKNMKEGFSLIPEKDLFSFLEERIGKLEGLVISGGEPTLQTDLKDFIVKVKKLGYKIKLDTNGTNPEKLLDLINDNLLDYIAMDIKAPLNSYEKIIGVKTDISKIKKSIKILIDGKIPYEFRTTLVPKLLNKGDVSKMASDIRGAKLWYLQKFKSDVHLVNDNFKNQTSFTDKQMKEFARTGSKHVNNCIVRE